MNTAAATASAAAISPAATPNARWYPAASAGVAGLFYGGAGGWGIR